MSRVRGYESAPGRRSITGSLTPNTRVRTGKMKAQPTMLILAAAVIVGTVGCVRESTRKELVDISLQAQLNTIATTIYYTGSDADYDYFYLNIPLGRNDACKVPRSENSVTNRMAVTRKHDSWRVFAPFAVISLTNAITIQDGTNTLIIVPGMNNQEKQKSEPPVAPYSSPAARSPQG
jgi:hypothetical protein